MVSSVSNPSALPVGHILHGRYRIESVMGERTRTITYSASCETDDSDVLITAYPTTQADEAALSAYLQESCRIRQLKHTGIVPLREAFHLGAYLYCVYEAPNAVPLSITRPETITLEWMYSFLYSMLGTLHYLHSQTPPVIHQAICPADILADPTGMSYFIGIANPLAAREYPSYTPLEQWASAAAPAAGGDIYALGATCYNLITGKPPRDFSPGAQNRAYSPLSAQPELRLRFAPSILASIDRALKLDRNDRWSSAAEWLDFLQQSPRQPATETPPSQRRKLICAAALAISAFLVLAAGIFVLPPHCRELSPQQKLEEQGILPESYNKALSNAIKSRDSVLLKTIIAAGADVNQAGSNGRAPLHHAIVMAYTQGLEQLLAAPGINVNQTDNEGNTPLHYAAYKGYTDYVRALLLTEAITPFPVNAQGGNPLHMAVASGNAETLAALLAVPGAPVNQADKVAFAPLHAAAKSGRTECLRLLLQVPGIDVNLTPDDAALTPVALAVADGQVSCLRELLAAPGIEAFKPDYYNNMTPLHQAAMYDVPECLQLLLPVPGCDVNARDAFGRTPLHIAIENSGMKCAALLLKAPGIDAAIPLSDGETALHICARVGNVELFRMLLSTAGVNPFATDISGSTPLHTAAACGRPGIIELLLPLYRDKVNTPDHAGHTPIDRAKQRKHSPCVELLQKANAEK